jgi:hypothetical protein
MLDAWKLALETLVYSRPSPQRTHAIQRVQARVRVLTPVHSTGDLRQIEDAAFGVRYLELVTGRRVDLAAGQLNPWMLATAG